MKKKEQQLQQQLLIQHHSFPSPITTSYDKKLFSSPSSSCRYDSGVSSGSSATEVSSYSSPSSSASTPAPNGASSGNSQRPSSSMNQYSFGDVYGSGGNFLSSSYASHHDLSRSCSALPSPTIYPPTPPPSSTPWLHPAWFGSIETAAGYLKTSKNNPFEN